MRWKIKSEAEQLAWRKWFAWHPVLLADDITYVWLETIERAISMDWDEIWDYRLRNNNDSK